MFDLLAKWKKSFASESGVEKGKPTEHEGKEQHKGKSACSFLEFKISVFRNVLNLLCYLI